VSGEPPAGGEIEVVLFDIDGTLISTGGASDRAWRRAFEELHGVAVDVGDYTGKGVPDPQVGLTTFRGAVGREPSAREMEELMALRLRYLRGEVARSENYRVMPGTERLLRRLTEEGRVIGLITGNVEEAAEIKLARAGLNRFFRFGGYGSDANERVDVARKALERAIGVLGREPDRDACMAFGDTPRDVEAAHGVGIRIVGVATGEYGPDELRDAGADFTVSSLEDGLPL